MGWPNRTASSGSFVLSFLFDRPIPDFDVRRTKPGHEIRDFQDPIIRRFIGSRLVQSFEREESAGKPMRSWLPRISRLDCSLLGFDNGRMTIRGQVRNGVVVLEGGQILPEGTKVTVSCDSAPISRRRPKKKRVQLPLVPSKRPGSLHLTNERIAEILEEEELSSFSKALR